MSSSDVLKVVSFGLTLGALGLKKLAENEAVAEIMKFGLSFILPDQIVDCLFNKLGNLGANEELLRELAAIGDKLDLLLGEAQTSSIQLLRDAFIAYENGNYKEAMQLLQEVRRNAFKAFNHTTSLDGWVTCTQLKITASYMIKSYEKGTGMLLFTQLSAERQREITQTIKGYIDDMLVKVDELKKETVEKARKVKFQEKKRLEEAKIKLRDIDQKVDVVLNRAYPLLSQGLSLTSPSQEVNPDAGSLSFDVLLKYVPEGKDDSVYILVASKPEIVVGLHRRLDFSYDTLDLLNLQLLVWTINDVMHQKLLSLEKNGKEPIHLTIERPELESLFRGPIPESERRVAVELPLSTPETLKSALIWENTQKQQKEGKNSDSYTKTLKKNVFGTGKKLLKSMDSTNNNSSASLSDKPDAMNGWKRTATRITIEPPPSPQPILEESTAPEEVVLIERQQEHTEVEEKKEENGHFSGTEEDLAAEVVSEPNAAGNGSRVRGRGFGRGSGGRGRGQSEGRGRGRGGRFGSNRRKPSSEAAAAAEKKSDAAALKCDDCGEILVGGYILYEGKNLCDKDFEKYKTKCSVCGESESESYFTDKDGHILCVDDYKKQLGIGLECKTCGNTVLDCEIVQAVDSLFHPHCFNCCQCGRNLSGAEDAFLADKEGNIYCKEDYQKQRRLLRKSNKPEAKEEKKEEVRCDDCGEIIVGSCIQYDGKNLCENDYEKYKVKCFVCGQSDLDSYYHDKEGRILCSKDYKEQQGGSLDCRICQIEVSSGEMVQAVDSFFHTRCFNCCKCGKNLAGEDVSFSADKEKNIYCREDYQIERKSMRMKKKLGGDIVVEQSQD